MSEYQPKAWQDSPDASTPIYASDLTRIENGVLEALTQRCSAEEITDILSSVLLQFTLTQGSYSVASTSSLQGTNPYLEFTANGLNIAYDGVVITKNGELIGKSNYTLSVRESATIIRVTFPGATFATGDTIKCYTFKNPLVSSSSIRNIVKCTQSEYDAMSIHSGAALYIITGAGT